MREVFIYYRVLSAHAEALRTAMAVWHAQLREVCPGLIARVLVRDEHGAPSQTWMEIYSTDPLGLPGGVDAALQRRIEVEGLRLAPLIDGPRHAEAFRPCVW
jgi:hypothetical protein